MNTASLVAVLGVALTAVGIFVPARISIRNDRAARARQVAQDQQAAITTAVAAATAPLQADLAQMTSDRDYWRTEAGKRQERIDTLSDELRQR